MNKLILFGIFGMLLLASCLKKEIPVAKADRGNAEIVTLSQGIHYENQIWYKLNGNRIISTNSRSAWDLQFEAGDKGNHVRLNSAKNMFAWNTGKLNFSEVTDTTGFSMFKQCDRVAALDSSVLGQFESYSTVYLIDLGVDDNSNSLRMIKKLKFLENKTTSFTFCYANVYGDTTTHYASFGKSDNYNFLQFSFTTGQLQSNIEPPKIDYDLEFTQFTYVFENPYQPYWVCGVLLNPSDVKACRINYKSYELVTINDTVQTPLTNKVDVIGYEWKKWDFNLAQYSYPNYTYIIKDMEGYFYKLRFITFENNSGQRGFPKFEYQKL